MDGCLSGEVRRVDREWLERHGGPTQNDIAVNTLNHLLAYSHEVSIREGVRRSATCVPSERGGGQIVTRKTSNMLGGASVLQAQGAVSVEIRQKTARVR